MIEFPCYLYILSIKFICLKIFAFGIKKQQFFQTSVFKRSYLETSTIKPKFCRLLQKAHWKNPSVGKFQTYIIGWVNKMFKVSKSFENIRWINQHPSQTSETSLHCYKSNEKTVKWHCGSNNRKELFNKFKFHTTNKCGTRARFLCFW